MSALAFLLLAVVVYIALLTAAMFLSQPIRLELAGLADEMADEPGRSNAERQHLDWMVHSSASSVVGLMLPFAALFTLALTLVGASLKPPSPLKRLDSDPRYDRAVILYVLSVAACSPFSTLIALPFVVLGVAAQAVRGEGHLMRAAEDPVLRASAALQPC